jgi:hypothetical protein
MRFAILIVLLFLRSLSIFSQKSDSSVYSFLGFQAHYGFIIPHSPAIEPVSHTNPFGFELSINKLKTSFESWKVFNHYNISGIQAGYFNFQNPEIVGSAYILTVFTEPILSHGNRFLFSIKGGAGISYLTKIYDPETNQTNMFFSSHLGFPLYLRARLRCRISDKTYLTLSGSYNHISNGAVKIPNYGINFPTVSIGIEYFQKPLPQLNNVYTPERHKKMSDQYLVIQALTGYKYVYGGPTYAFGLHTRFTRQIRPKYALNGGAEIILNGGVKKMIEIEDLDLDYKRVALTVGQDFIFGKVILTQYFGFYIYAPYKAESFVYEKYELSYSFSRHIITGVFLQAYASHAELLGLSFNYVIRKR